MTAIGDCIFKASQRILQLMGTHFDTIYVPMGNDVLSQALQTNQVLALAICHSMARIDCHYPPLAFFNHKVIREPLPICSEKPLSALMVFTDASGRTGLSGILWTDPHTGEKRSHRILGSGSVQVLELQAVCLALQLWESPINIVTDSKYVASLVPRLHRSSLRHISNERLFQQLTNLWHLKQQTMPLFYHAYSKPYFYPWLYH